MKHRCSLLEGMVSIFGKMQDQLQLGTNLLFQPLVLCGVAAIQSFGLPIKQPDKPTFLPHLVPQSAYQRVPVNFGIHDLFWAGIRPTCWPDSFEARQPFEYGFDRSGIQSVRSSGRSRTTSCFRSSTSPILSSAFPAVLSFFAPAAT